MSECHKHSCTDEVLHKAPIVKRAYQVSTSEWGIGMGRSKEEQ
jgi:hypothetical protein